MKVVLTNFAAAQTSRWSVTLLPQVIGEAFFCWADQRGMAGSFYPSVSSLIWSTEQQTGCIVLEMGSD